MKKKSISQLKKEVDKIFSLFIRQRGSIKGYNSCFTCGLRREWKKLQCGHFISRTHSNTRYDEINCQVQCFACNVWKRGNIAEFAARLIEKYGQKEFNNLIKKGRQLKQFTEKELLELKEKFKNV